MGCDIHLAVEVRRDGQWHRALPPEHVRSPWLVEYAAENPDNAWAVEHARVVWYDSRNYNVFAVLANVRNDGFIKPIAEPRGLPDDMSDEVARLDGEHPAHDYGSHDVSLGDHSQSWLTLAELQAYPWDGEATEEGVVELDQFIRRVMTLGNAVPVRAERAPYDGWCGDVFGRDIVVRPAAEVIAALQSGGLATPPTERTYVRDQWSTRVRVQAGDFTERFLPALAELGAPEDVRIVFGFDS